MWYWSFSYVLQEMFSWRNKNIAIFLVENSILDRALIIQCKEQTDKPNRDLEITLEIYILSVKVV